jgi:hypothetical protein
VSSLYTRLKITLGKANADEHALQALQSDYKVVVTEERDIVFRPASNRPAIGVILYPGGRCDARAYAPVMRPLSATDGNNPGSAGFYKPNSVLIWH